ncbi:hypothetical protein [Rhodococcus wratislaviensis]|uniref:hypothetical protein n=1 Tax=Rhodococcus wratislaviensis TaxID=44752 RepID=UPI003655D478
MDEANPAGFVVILVHNQAVPLPSNPAERLATIFQRILASDRNNPTKHVIASILETSGDVSLARSLSYVFALPDKIVDALRSLELEEDDLQWHLGWLPPAQRALTDLWQFNAAIHNVQQHFSPTDLVNLESANRLLRREKFERRIEEAQLDSLGEKVRELHDALVAAADIPDDLKLFMLDQLDQIARALREFRIRGPEALTEALDSVVGAIYRVSSSRPGAVTPETRTWFQKLRTVVADLALVVGLGAAVLQLPANFHSAVNELSPATQVQSQVESTPSPPDPISDPAQPPIESPAS